MLHCKFKQATTLLAAIGRIAPALLQITLSMLSMPTLQPSDIHSAFTMSQGRGDGPKASIRL